MVIKDHNGNPIRLNTLVHVYRTPNDVTSLLYSGIIKNYGRGYVLCSHPQRYSGELPLRIVMAHYTVCCVFGTI